VAEINFRVKMSKRKCFSVAEKADFAKSLGIAYATLQAIDFEAGSRCETEFGKI